MTPRVTIVDYGIGNLFNLQRAFEHCGADCSLVTDPRAVRDAGLLVLPGVGAFGEGITNLESRGLAQAVREHAATGKPLFGICLGMQLLFSSSEELGVWRGLDLVPGTVVRFRSGPWKLPQITWNSLEEERPWSGTILGAIKSHALMYFNHSYHVIPRDPSAMLASTAYADTSFASVIRHENISACQFHPERSAHAGLAVLKQFVTSAE